jgi:hypothetical protein
MIDVVAKEEFTVQEAARITGASERNIRFWAGPAAVITPEVADPKVQRSPKLFSPRNLFQLAVVKILTDRWIGLDVVRGMLQKRKVDWWKSDLRQTEVIVFRDGKNWGYRFTPVPPPGNSLPEGILEPLEKDIVDAEDVVIVNLSKVKRRILEAL